MLNITITRSIRHVLVGAGSMFSLLDEFVGGEQSKSDSHNGEHHHHSDAPCWHFILVNLFK